MPSSNDETGYTGILRNGIPAILKNAAAPCALLLNLSLFSHAGGKNWMAAWAIVQSTVTFLQGMFNFLIYVPMAQIAHSVGRGSLKELPRCVTCALWTAVAVGLICTWCICWGFYGGAVFRIMEVEEEVRSLALSYLLGRLPSVLLVFVNRVCTGVLVGKQRIRVVTCVNLVMNVADVAGNYWVLLYLKLGLFEAGLATSAATLGGILIILPIAIMLDPVLEKNGDEDEHVANREPANDDEFSIVDFLRSSTDMMARSVLLQGAMYSLSITASRIGTPQLAAHQVVIQIWSLVSFCCDGFADVGTMVGARLLGAQQHDQMLALTRRLFILALLSGLACTTVLLWKQDRVISFFVTAGDADMDTKTQLNSVWMLTALMQPVNAVVFVSDGLLFAHRAFAYIRNLMIIGVVVVFGPALAFGFVTFQTLFSLWVAKSMLSAWRCLAAIWFCWSYRARQRKVVDVCHGITEASPLLVQMSSWLFDNYFYHLF